MGILQIIFGDASKAMQYDSVDGMELFSLNDLANGKTIHDSGGDTSYDPDANDAFTQTINGIVDDLVNEYQNADWLQEFIAEDWDNNDRTRWEEDILFHDIRQRLNETVVLSDQHYRNESQYEGVTRHDSLNALSTDLENGTLSVEWDCERQSAVMGMIATMVEQQVLPQPKSGQNPDYNNPQDYIYASARAYFTTTQTADFINGYHAFIVSKASGNLIEATSGDYKKALSPEYGYDDFAAGVPFLTKDGNIYGPRNLSEDRIQDEIQTRLNDALNASLTVSSMAAEYALRADNNPEIAALTTQMEAITSGLPLLSEISEGHNLPVFIMEENADNESRYDTMAERISTITRENPELHALIEGEIYNPAQLIGEAFDTTRHIFELAELHNIDLDTELINNIANNLSIALNTETIQNQHFQTENLFAPDGSVAIFTSLERFQPLNEWIDDLQGSSIMMPHAATAPQIEENLGFSSP